VTARSPAPDERVLPAVLAIDGGNSKTDMALVAADGTVLASVCGPGMPRTSSLESTLDMLSGLVDEAQRRIGRSGFPAAEHTSACLANLDLPDEDERMAQGLRARRLSVSNDVVNDTFAVLRAGLRGDSDAPASATRQPRRLWGVAVVCGTGINCVGLDPNGRTARFLALGDFSGDWGGGTRLSTMTLWCAMRAEDGRGPETALRAAVAAHFGTTSVENVALGIHRGTIAPDDLPALVPLLLVVAGAGDPVARSIVTRQAEEICAMALSAMRRLDLIGAATPVVLGGGVLSARDPVLTARIEAGLAAAAPQAQVCIADIPPVAGAALRGLDFVGAEPSAERRLRSVYCTVAQP